MPHAQCPTTNHCTDAINRVSTTTNHCTDAINRVSTTTNHCTDAINRVSTTTNHQPPQRGLCVGIPTARGNLAGVVAIFRKYKQ
jgi:hypothetical protein